MNDPPIVLTAQKVAKAFLSGGRIISVLKSADLEVRKGESVSIRGESGSGKTTLLNLIAGLETPDAGMISWENSRVNGADPTNLARRRARWVGMVFQAYYLIPEIDALENVLMAARIAGKAGREERKRAITLMERVGLGERLHSRTTHLSGGERQRVALARALMNSPALILADEPTGNLDEKTGLGVMELLLEICSEEGASLILVTHNPDFAARTGRQLYLNEGILHELGGPAP